MRIHSPYRSHGFTLAELVVVCAILLIVVALAFPVMRKIRGSNERMQCVANLRTVGAGMLAVAAESNGRLPALGKSQGDQRPTWGMKTAQALGISLSVRAQKTVFWCPTDKSAEEENGPWMHANHVGHSSYAANVNLVDWDEGSSTLGGTARGGARLGDIPSPGRTLLLMENHRPNNVISWSDQAGKTYQAGWTYEYTLRGQNEATDPGKRGYHDGLNNWFFADGHIEALRFQDTLTPVNLWIKTAH